ncbi:hypothetical protein WOLCODRAFT_115327 [Wolfiporia cocos MD-104 SS10]|uniref:PIN domain-containing protein n=1 Tax=Wolfiporia cocos (strain MD-104) TaxID=742152 RepID=A0A2H3J7W5_WOLCO|nr:hypothetical protein WOLCODRAFT_115327 [Wolfiporia cocos MD-104 SS10]
MDADADEFSRRLRISAHSPRSAHARTQAGPSASPGRLYNPNADHGRRQAFSAEPDSMSDAASSSYAPRGPVPQGPRAHPPASSRAAADSHRQLFDHRKDDPVRFSVLARPQVSPKGAPNAGRPPPTPKSSGDYVSASSTSSASYAQSTISSNFTLSTTSDSSAPSSLFDNQNSRARRSEDSASSTNAFSMQLKKLYREITALETKIQSEDRDKDREDGERDAPRVGVLVKSRNGAAPELKGDEQEKDKWRRLMQDHKDLAERVQNLLTLTLAPSVPASLRNIPAKYNLITRLWAHAFHRLLESLRRAASPPHESYVALEYLQDFIYYAYTFYTGLLEERNLADLRINWVEALGDLARYRMTASALLDNAQGASGMLTTSALATAAGTPRGTSVRSGSSGHAELPVNPPARIDDSPRLAGDVPSVGLAAAKRMELEPERERWRQIARDWYARGLAGTPGTGKLHHHLGLLSRDKDGHEEELRGMYHFIKSMIAFRPFDTSRESILQLWSPLAQKRRQAPEAGLTELFVLLHGMLFTNIQLDDFRGVLERFDEKLKIEGGSVVEERDWIMMAVANLGAVLEFGRENAVLRGISARDAAFRAGVRPADAGRVKLMAKRADDDDKKMDVDGDDAAPDARRFAAMQVSPVLSPAPAAPEVPPALKLGMQLTFSMLAHALKQPFRKASPHARSTLSPYITVVLTFLATALKEPTALAVLERAVPWAELAGFLNTIPRRCLFPEQQKELADAVPLLTSATKPLPEDWCLRGLGWVGKRVYPQGFWGREASAEERTAELDVLERVEAADQRDGVIEDGDGEDTQADARRKETERRWVRIARAGLKIAKAVDGFTYVPAPNENERGQWRIEGALAAKVAQWQEEDRREREEEERRLRGRRWDEDSMDIDDDESPVAEDFTDESGDDEADSDEVKALKARRRYLQSLLQSTARSEFSSRRQPRGPSAYKQSRSRPALPIIPGYTIIVIDTNILLSSLSMFATLVESVQWTVVVPLPVIMELDGLSANFSPLGDAAKAALEYITSHLRTHQKSMKVQTSKGNYLTNLAIRTELVDFDGDEGSWERNMDDLILRAAIWQDEHWVDRSTLLGSSASDRDTTGAAKVVLLSFDRMLRLKARSRQLCAANEQDLVSILAPGR